MYHKTWIWFLCSVTDENAITICAKRIFRSISTKQLWSCVKTSSKPQNNDYEWGMLNRAKCNNWIQIWNVAEIEIEGVEVISSRKNSIGTATTATIGQKYRSKCLAPQQQQQQQQFGATSAPPCWATISIRADPGRSWQVLMVARLLVTRLFGLSSHIPSQSPCVLLAAQFFRCMQF